MKKEKKYYYLGWLTGAILFLLSLLPFSQCYGQDKGTGWLYFSTTPNTTPNTATGSELAWRTDTKEVYYWDRTANSWKKYLNFFQGSGVPILNPTVGTNYNNFKIYIDFLNAQLYRWNGSNWETLGGVAVPIKRINSSSPSMQVKNGGVVDSVGINYDSLSAIDAKKVANKIQDSISYVELDPAQAMSIAAKIMETASAKKIIQDSTSIIDTITVVNDTTLRVFLQNGTNYNLVVKGKGGITKSILIRGNTGEKLLNGITDTFNITSSLGIFQTIVSNNTLLINFIGGQDGEILTVSGGGYYWGQGIKVDSVYAKNDTVLTIVLRNNSTYDVPVKGRKSTQSPIKFTDLDFSNTSGFSDFVDNASSGGSGDGVITLISRPHPDTLLVTGQDGAFSGKIYIGRTWEEVKGKPSGFADNIDNVNDPDSIFGNELITNRIIRNDSIFLIENGTEWFSGKNATGGGTQNLNSVLTQSNDAGGLKITGLANPTQLSDAVNLQYLNTNADISNTNEIEILMSPSSDLTGGAVFAPFMLGYRRDNGTLFFNNNGVWAGFNFLKTEVDGSITNEKIDSFVYQLGILRIKEGGANYNLSLNTIPLSAFQNDLGLQGSSLTNNFIWQGNSSGVAQGFDVTGDVELIQGVTTIQANAVTTTKINNAAITPEKLDRTYHTTAFFSNRETFNVNTGNSITVSEILPTNPNLIRVLRDGIEVFNAVKSGNQFTFSPAFVQGEQITIIY